MDREEWGDASVFENNEAVFEWLAKPYNQRKPSKTSLRASRDMRGEQSNDSGATSATQITLRTAAPSGTTPFRWRWVLWRSAGRTTLLMTEGGGKLRKAVRGDNPPAVNDFMDPFTAAMGSTAEIAVCDGARPLALSFARAQNIFIPVTVAASLTVSPNVVNISTPTDLSVWPMLHTFYGDAYEQSGLTQGAPAFSSNGSQTQAEYAPAAPPLAADRPLPQPLMVTGDVDNAITEVKVMIVDSSGTAQNLRLPDGSTVSQATATTTPGPDGRRTFSKAIQLADPAAAFGLVQVFVQASSPASQAAAWNCRSVLLCGWKLDLVDDFESNVNGTLSGPNKHEGSDQVVLDFLESPKDSMASLRGQARVRRMTVHKIRAVRRMVNSVPTFEQPQMPLWMAELQWIGVSPSRLREFLTWRYQDKHHGLIDPYAADILRIELGWRLRLQWTGPDSHAHLFPALDRHDQEYSYRQDFDANQIIEIRYGPHGEFTDATGSALTLPTDGSIATAITPPPSAVNFPIIGRRRPRVQTSQARAIGRAATARTLGSLVIEHQPRLLIEGAEKIRGGDAQLSLQSARLDGRTISGTGSGALLNIPTVRVIGSNPSGQTEVNEIVDAIVAETFNAVTPRPDHIGALALLTWQTTLRRIFSHESRVAHFDNRPSRGITFSGHVYGRERNMPIFGPPHGYGIGQLDSPAATHDQVWNFVDNIRGSVNLLMNTKGRAAWNRLQADLPNPRNQRARAIYQREVVRNYNGGREFALSAGVLRISPSISRLKDGEPNPRLNYPNAVLGTAITYFTGTGSTANFPWPIDFTSANYGPDTDQT